MELTVVIPAYNEAAKIECDLVAARDYLQLKGACEILVVDDGSTDDTHRIVERFIARHDKSCSVAIRLLSYGGNRGKGFAVRHGILESKGRRVAFVDSGLCVPYSNLDRGLAMIDQGFDVAIASRRLEGACVKRRQPIYRRVGSHVFWRLMRMVMGIGVTDTQCGFKVYRGGAARQLFSFVKTDGFMFDIEALCEAQRQDMAIAEFPVEWSNDNDTRYRPVLGTCKNFTELFWIRYRQLFTRRRLCETRLP